MAADRRIEIKEMSISDIEKILLQRYKINNERIEKYTDDIKRDLLFDLETHVGK